jgi:glycosyltransferase involved in cell wall biosynthesis
MDASIGEYFIRKRVLYITYDGLKEPLGQSQVWPYIRGLAEKGHEFEVLSYEKPGVSLRYREKLAPGVYWTALRYHKKFSILATLFDLKLGFFVASWLILKGRVNLIHARSYIPALLALILVTIFRLRWIFDTRGLWADEKVESGTWSPTSLVYRFFKKAEQVFFRRASAITVLTRRYEVYLQDKTRVPVTVIPTCVDLKKFDAAQWSEGILIYVGSLGGLYLHDEIIRFYRYWRKYAPNPKLWMVSNCPLMQLETDIRDEVVYFSVEHQEIPGLLGQAQAAVCFIKPTFSKLASSPTKLGEFLSCGVPVAANLIGDMGVILQNTVAGVVLSDFSDESLDNAARELYKRSINPEVRLEARRLAKQWFDLEAGVQKYHEIYQKLCAV